MASRRLQAARARVWRVAVAALALLACAEERDPAPPAAALRPRAATEASDVARGRELSLGVCASCHLYPEPDLVDRFTWAFETLPAMAIWMGFSRFDYDAVPGGAHLRAAGVLPDQPLTSLSDWRAIAAYYLAAAPAEPRPQPQRTPIGIGLPRFAAQPVRTGRGPWYTLVQIDAAARRLYLGSARDGSLDVLGPDGERLASRTLPSPPVHVAPTEGGLFVTAMGSFTPTDEPTGSVFFLPADGGEARVVLRELRRPLHTTPADLNGDGLVDLAVSEFGHRMGALRWFENRGGGRFEPRVLLERPGALRTEVRDFDGDGLPDLLVLMAQAREGLYLFENRGGGRFEMRTLLEQHPAWGYTGFQLVDADGDEHPDLLTTNGDNAESVDYPAPTKPYHGVRLYLNDGANVFREAFFYPLNGAYGARAADFDADGDLDLAAIAYFPDYRRSPQESFVYLENQGGLRFTAATFEDSLAGRWIVLDAGDLDGDGDADLSLAAYNEGPGGVPAVLAEAWPREGAPVMILRNQALP